MHTLLQLFFESPFQLSMVEIQGSMNLEYFFQTKVHYHILEHECCKDYTRGHIVWDGPWQDFKFDPINQKLYVVQKQMIYYLKPLIVGLWIPGGQGRGRLICSPLPLFVKSVLFRRKGRGNCLSLPRPCSPGILKPTIRALKWYIINYFATPTFRNN